MAGYKLLVAPLMASYAVRPGSNNDVNRVQLEGGAGRYRRGLANSSKLVDVMWTVPGDLYEYLDTFYSTVTTEGSIPFRVDLVLDKKRAAEHNAFFIPGTWVLIGKNGNMFTVTAQLEVTPIQRNYEADSMLLAMIEMFGFSPNWETQEAVFYSIVTDLTTIPYE